MCALASMEMVYRFSLLVSLALIIPTHTLGGNSKVFREYIAAELKNLKISDVPINPKVQFHFILAFAIDYTQSQTSPSPTNGKFNVFWDSANLSPREVKATKSRHPNVKVALSLGGDSVGTGSKLQFVASSVSSWVSNAVSSLSKIIKEYHLDGIDIDYEHFDQSQPQVFAECIGQLITSLKRNHVISFASIAPFDDAKVQSHYGALWRKYGHVIDFVNFQFYAYDKNTTVAQFIGHYNDQKSRYKGGKVLVSFGTDTTSGGLSPQRGFFRACTILQKSGKLEGIFVWSADDSKREGFLYEKQSQALLA